METIVGTSRGRNSRDLCALRDVPLALSIFDATENALMIRWARSEAQTRNREALLKEAQAIRISIERAERLCDRLLNEGWVSRREQLTGGVWLWKSITWRDLSRLQGLLGLSNAGQRLQVRQEKIAQATEWLAMRNAVTAEASIDPDLLDELTQGVAELKQDKSLRLDVLEARLELLKAIASWRDSGQQGLRRNFALHARDTTKALSSTEWRWLESIFDLERLGIGNFAQVAWFSGDIDLSWGISKLELAPLHCLAVPLDDLQRVDKVRAPKRWWLIENRASFEQQARHRPDGVAILWMPGRPSNTWLMTISYLLQHAPAPAWISADADPAGVDIACSAGKCWELAGLDWEPHLMGITQWEATVQRWPLNDHDRRLLSTLIEKSSLPHPLRTLCKAMQQEGRKAEQEAWL